jgi:hypothetical protein
VLRLASLAGVAEVTATRAAAFKTTTALRAERYFGAVGTVTPRTETADQNGGYLESSADNAW